MGYYSQVAMRVETVNGLSAKGLFNDLMQDLMAQGFDADYFNSQEISIDPNDDILTIYLESVKWYDSYKDVQIIESWFQKCSQAAMDWVEGIGDNDLPTISGAQYIHIGEEYDDIANEEYGDMAEPMYINRSIEI